MDGRVEGAGSMKTERKKNNSGETLVESIIAFAVLLLILAAATAAMLGAIRLNKRAITVSRTLEEACSAVEIDAGAAVADAELTLMFDASAPESFSGLGPIAVDFKSADPLWYFSPKGENDG